VKLFGVGAFTLASQDSVSFTSRIDRKGRALISARIRKILRLGYGSSILVKLNGSGFVSKIDERGRFSVPFLLRGKASFIEGYVGRCLP
jgi:bifunctional DNA-binding transcriptional regulator/antitoxin component of YhaV-PrlF toxin-antitoxin module